MASAADSQSSSDLKAFYERSYRTSAPTEAQLYGEYGAVAAHAKADHVIELTRQAGLAPDRVLDVGCGVGAVLAELAQRGFGSQHAGLEIAESAVVIARSRGLDVELFDGSRLPLAGGSSDLGVLCHVLEHVEDPTALLAEVARVCQAVVVEVPLEANLSARRRSKSAGRLEVGHLHVFDRAGVRQVVERAGLEVVAELTDPLALAVHRFFADTFRERAKAFSKAFVRRLVFGVSPTLAERLFTVHYACLVARVGTGGRAIHR